MDYTTKTLIENLNSIVDTNVDSINDIIKAVSKLQNKVKQLENIVLAHDDDINQLYHLVGEKGESD